MTAPKTAPTSDRASRYDPFVAKIIQICRTEPRRRSELRRGLRLPPEKAVTMHAVVAPWLPDPNKREEERAYYTVAAMIAAQPRKARDPEATEETTIDGPTDLADAALSAGAAQQKPPNGRLNLGRSLAEAARRASSGQDRGIAEETAEKRLHLLVRQDLDGIHRQLPGVVGHLRALNVRVDWAQLMADLASWPRGRDRTTKEWLQTFYRTLHPQPSEENQQHV